MSDPEARYVYCVVPGETTDWRLAGLEGNPVRALCAAGLTALVHDCPAEPYQGDDEKVKAWALAHGDVVDAAWERAGTVLPLGFDTIVRPGDEVDGDERVRRWLSTEGPRFHGLLERLRGKVELGVQILWDQKVMGEAVAQGDEEVRRLRRDLEGKSKGQAYFHQQKVARAVRQAIEARADADYHACFDRLAVIASEVRSNEVKRIPGHLMILNLSVLAPRERVSEIGDVLAGFEADGVEVRFTGPWPPYSFANGAPAPETGLDRNRR